MNAVQKYLAEIGRKGGSASTPAKSEAARLNGKKGGRPKKKKS
jgi:general stress protein YciG